MVDFFTLFFPKKCIFCRKKSESEICDGCQAELPWILEQEGGCLAPLAYTGLVREMLHRFKFGGRTGYARLLGALIGDCLRDARMAEADIISWVPSSALRIRKRGYDQSRLLANETGRRLSLPVVGLLEKTRHNESQNKLSDPEERRRNVAGAFISCARLSGETVILVDDIYTTGATMRECAGALASAGAGKVTMVCVARKSLKI